MNLPANTNTIASEGDSTFVVDPILRVLDPVPILPEPIVNYQPYQFLAVVVAVVLIKILLNIRALRLLNKYERRYEAYLKNNSDRFIEDIPHLQDLFRKAGMPDATINHIEAIGFGRIRSTQPQVLQNLHMRTEDFVMNIIQFFKRSRGVYRKRLLDSISPTFWLETVVFFPRAMLGYLGISGETIFVRLLQLMYWIASAAFAVKRYWDIVQ